ncbi:MAG: hypothetical protein ACI8WB_004231 [Phenylobacterium sp.]|jgi:hypothetical protein
MGFKTRAQVHYLAIKSFLFYNHVDVHKKKVKINFIFFTLFLKLTYTLNSIWVQTEKSNSSACLGFASEQGIVARKIGAYRSYVTV